MNGVVGGQHPDLSREGLIVVVQDEVLIRALVGSHCVPLSVSWTVSACDCKYSVLYQPSFVLIICRVILKCSVRAIDLIRHESSVSVG